MVLRPFGMRLLFSLRVGCTFLQRRLPGSLDIVEDTRVTIADDNTQADCDTGREVDYEEGQS